MSSQHTQQFPSLVESRRAAQRDSSRGDDPVEAPTRKTAILGHWLQRSVLAFVLAVFGLLVLTVGSAFASNFTWSGAAAVGEGKWSNSANWEGGTAPSGSVGTLTFPKLTSPACTSSPPTAPCHSSVNDLSGLSVNTITIENQLKAFTGGSGESGEYFIGGNAITLGAGGLTATSHSGGAVLGEAALGLPIALGASQSWSLDGAGVVTLASIRQQCLCIGCCG